MLATTKVYMRVLQTKITKKPNKFQTRGRRGGGECARCAEPIFAFSNLHYSIFSLFGMQIIDTRLKQKIATAYRSENEQYACH